MKSFLSLLHKFDRLLDRSSDRDRISTISRLVSIPLLPLIVILSPSIATAVPPTSTDIYVLSGTSTTKNINTLNTTSGTLSTSIFTSAVGNSAALGLDPNGLQLYYADRNTTANQLRRYNGTTESASLGTFPGTNNLTTSGNPILRMGFSGSTGYAISDNNTAYTFTTATTPVITSKGVVSFQGTSPSGIINSGDIAFDGFGFGWAIFGNSLYRLNFNTGTNPPQAIPIGQVNIAGTPLAVVTSGNGTTVGSIAFGSDGALYIAGVTVVANAATGTTIYKVNINDATATQVGSLLSGTVISDFASGNQPSITPNIVSTKSVSPTGPVMPGDTLTYTIEVENTGTAPAVNVDFIDVLPPGITYVANSATLNGTNLAATAYPFGTAYRINGRTASPGSLKVGNANRATVAFKVTVNTTSVPTSINNEGVVTYLDGATNGIPTSTAGSPVASPVSGYKSVKLTNDADGSGTITPGDTVTWTISYKNGSTAAVNNFQISDALPTGVTLAPTGSQTVTFSGTGTSATKNSTYTGAATGTVSNLLSASATIGAGGVVTVSIPTVINTGFVGTLSNQSNATGSSLPGTTGTFTDNVDNTSTVPAGVTVPTTSIVQTQNTTVDATTATVVLPTVSISGKVWNDVDGSGNGGFNLITTPPGESGTNAGGLFAILIDGSTIKKVIASVAVNPNGTYIFPGIAPNQTGLTIELSTTPGTPGSTTIPTPAVPIGWKSTAPKITPAFDVALADISNKDFGITQPANAILVKRITAINGLTTNDGKDLTAVVDPTTTTTTNDDATKKWPAGYLKGAVNAGRIKPEDTIEYTIYYLNDGVADAKTLKICDPIRGSQKYVPGSMKLIPGGSTTPIALTDSATDTTVDRANTYGDAALPAVVTAPTDCNAGSIDQSLKDVKDNGGVAIQIIGTGASPQPTLPALNGSTGFGAPATSYGSFKFTTKVDK